MQQSSSLNFSGKRAIRKPTAKVVSMDNVEIFGVKMEGGVKEHMNSVSVFVLARERNTAEVMSPSYLSVL